MTLGPVWFHGIDSIFDAIFCIIAGIMMWRGFQAYRFFNKDTATDKTKRERYRLFSSGFLFLSASYVIAGLTHFLVFREEREHDLLAFKMWEINTTITWGFLLHALLFLIGMTFLLIMYLQVDDRAVRILLFVLVLFSVFLSNHVASMFYLLLGTLFLFIIVKLYKNHRLKRHASSLLVLLGFIGLLIGEVLLGAIFISEVVYVIALCITLAGYSSIFASQLMPK